MNPKTRLTADQVKAICKRHGISYRLHSRIPSGFSHEVHRLNNDLVLKIYSEKTAMDSARLYTTEANLLASALPFPKPRLVARSDAFQDIDRRYVVMTYVPGISLGSVWHKATELQREALIAEISHALQVINSTSPASLELSRSGSWSDHIYTRSMQLLEDLRRKGILRKELLQKTRRTIANSISYFNDSELHPVFWDIHFDNFLVDDKFKLQALIDLEAVELTPLDYPLFVIRKQMQEPEKYLSEANERFADPKDYLNLETYYRKYYPEMFNGLNLETRVMIYQILDRLHLILHWPYVQENYDTLEYLIAELSKKN